MIPLINGSFAEQQLHNRISELEDRVEHFFSREAEREEKIDELNSVIETLQENQEKHLEYLTLIQTNLQRCHENVLNCWKDLGETRKDYERASGRIEETLDVTIKLKNSICQTRKNVTDLSCATKKHFDKIENKMKALEDDITNAMRNLKI